jgi:Fic family protein
MYNAIHQFEPLLPQESASQDVLLKAHVLQQAAQRCSQIAAESVRSSLAPLLRAMNSYYTNRLEGQHTLPAELERATRRQFDADADIQRKQRIALAHMATEQWAERVHGDASPQTLYSTDTVCALHGHLFGQLNDDARRLENGSIMTPGELRTRDVTVGHHTAPAFAAVPEFLARWQAMYGKVRPGELAIVAAAASHHRLAWIHPFEDGNGRVARLHTHVILHALGLTGGLWSPLRGLARSHERYYQALAAADAPRAGDLDGRGNLSERGLLAFIEYFLDVCIDQATFMSKLLDASAIKERISACLIFESQKAGSGIRQEALNPLHYVFLSGPLERGQFKAMTGLKPRTAESLMTALLKRNLLESDTPKGKVKFGTPLHALRFYFPALWPEAEAGEN